MKPVTKGEIKEAFARLGLSPGDTVMVHTSLGKIGYVCGGAQSVIEALIETVGPEGTVMMPTQSWKNLDPEDGVHWTVAEEDWQTIRDNWPAYDARITPTNTMGAVAEMFRSWPGTVRSGHPARSVAVWGKHARYLVSEHDLSNIFGEGSPIGKLYELDAWVLLIGVGYDKNTSLHLADARAQYPGKHTCIEHSAVMEGGKRVWKAYETLYVDGEDFEAIGAAFEERNTVRRGSAGGAQLRLMKQRDLIDFAVEWIERNRRAETGNKIDE
ncbi:MAG: AAC(3) family N-acetyltransferase [Oscillospiraceae bacterium]|nr:AAC(3) family N-acetyltransferase [Oscillospiraceae bacterium]